MREGSEGEEEGRVSVRGPRRGGVGRRRATAVVGVAQAPRAIAKKTKKRMSGAEREETRREKKGAAPRLLWQSK